MLPPVTRISRKSRSNFCFPWDHFLHHLTLDDSNHIRRAHGKSKPNAVLQFKTLNLFYCSCLLGVFVLETLRWLNTVLAVCEYMSFAKSWQEKGCSSQAETWQVKTILMKDFDWQVKCDVFIVSMATWTIEYNLKISLLLLHKKLTH